MALTNDIRRTLVERVERRVAGRGISRRTIVDAVDKVADALATSPDPSCACSPHHAEIVAAVTAASMPDLASRVRDGLSRSGVVVADMGSATAGRHTVVTLRLPERARVELESVAATIGARVSIQSSGVEG